jgi:hypothetical protein
MAKLANWMVKIISVMMMGRKDDEGAINWPLRGVGSPK